VRVLAALGVLCAVVPALAMWGFTVDDALIPVRYARHLVSGAGYRFNAAGASTDGVTPLPWVFVVAAVAAKGDALATLARLKVLGIMLWGIAGGVLGARVGSAARGRARVGTAAAALIVMGTAFEIGAWAGSGMETGAALALATIAAARLGARRPKMVAGLAGLVATLRPEMVVWAIVIGGGAGLVGSANERGPEDEGERRPREDWLKQAIGGSAIAAGPFVLCAAVRWAVFGRPAPLAVLAKPSDLSHGLVYAAAAALVLLTPLLVAAPIAIVKGRRMGVARVVVLAFVAHVLAVTAAGGDWMPYARLVVPAAPSLVIAVLDVARSSRFTFVVAARFAAAAVLGALLLVKTAPAGRDVYADRADLIVRARPLLADAKVVAALDIGWVGAATDATIMDLAGLTDPAIAMLPGGHTSKRVDTSMLLDRDVDTVIVYSAMRVVEARLVDSELFESRYEAAAKLPVGSRGATYTLYRRRPRE
jgi:hypothetical protein